MTKHIEPILKGEPILYQADGTQEEVKPANGKKFELKELQKFVHGTAASADRWQDGFPRNGHGLPRDVLPPSILTT